MTEQDVERDVAMHRIMFEAIYREMNRPCTGLNLNDALYVAIDEWRAAMPNNHEKALAVARHKIGAALLLATPDHDVPQDSRNMIYTQEANAIRGILSDALATIDEIVGE